MRYLKLTALTAVMLLALSGTASATIATSPKGTNYTGTFKAESSNLTGHGAFISVSCTSSAVEGKLETHGSSVTAAGKLNSLSFSGCNYTVTVKKVGTVVAHAGGAVTSTGLEISVHTSVGECVFTTNATAVGTGTGGGPAKLDIDSAAIPRTGGSFFCGSSGEVTGNYTITTPSTLFLD